MKIKNIITAASALCLCTSMANAAVDLDFRQAFGGYHNSLYFASGEGWGVTVTASGGSNRVSQVDDGLGNGSNGFNYLLAKNESLTFTFDQQVNIGEIVLSADFSNGYVDLAWEGGTISDLYAPIDSPPSFNAVHALNITTQQFTVTGTDNYALIEGLNNVSVSAVPVPAAAWLFGSALLGLAGVGRKQRQTL